MSKFFSTHWGKLVGSLVTIGGLTLGGVYTYEQGAQKACEAVVSEVAAEVFHKDNGTTADTESIGKAQ